MICLNCAFWDADEYQYEPTDNPEYNDAVCTKIGDVIDIYLGCSGYGCGGEYVDEIYTNQNFGCTCFKQRT